jgi:hypothetical protein
VFQAPIGFFEPDNFFPGELIALQIAKGQKPYKFWPRSSAALGHWVILRESRTQTTRIAIIVDEEIEYDATKKHIFKPGYGWRNRTERGKKREWWGYRIERWVRFEPRLVNKISVAQGGPKKLDENIGKEWHAFLTQLACQGGEPIRTDNNNET